MTNSNFDFSNDGDVDEAMAALTAGTEPVSESSILDDLRDEFSQDKEEDIRSYVVTARPDISVLFSTNIDYDLLKEWFKRATEGSGQRKSFNPLKLAHIVLTNQTRGIVSKGHPVTKDSTELTLVDEAWWRDLLGASDPRMGLRKLFKSEGLLMAQSQQIITDAGYADVDIEDGDSPFGRG